MNSIMRIFILFISILVLSRPDTIRAESYVSTKQFDPTVAYSSQNLIWEQCITGLSDFSQIESARLDIRSQIWSWGNYPYEQSLLCSDSNTFYYPQDEIGTLTSATHPNPSEMYDIQFLLPPSQLERLKNDGCINFQMLTFFGTYYMEKAVLTVYTAGDHPQSDTVFVDAENGNDQTGDGSRGASYQTIAKGLAAASDGEIVKLLPGSYNEHVYLKSNVRLEGESPANTRIIGNIFARNITNAAVRYVTITDTDTCGIHVYNSSIEVANTIIFGQPHHGILLRNSQVKVTNNTIAGNGYTGIQFENSSSAEVTNTILVMNGRFGLDFLSSQPSRIAFNTIWGNGWGDQHGANDQIVFEKNKAHNPHFIDMAGEDFHLSEGSPCIDAGDPASTSEEEPRPNGDRINQGAYGNTYEAAITTDTLIVDDSVYVDSNNGIDESGDGSSGKPFKTIKKGISMASAGGMVHVLPGTYTERVDLVSDVILSGAGPSNTILIGDVFAWSVSNGHIRGFRITDSSTCGLHIYDSTIEITNNVIYGQVHHGILLTNSEVQITNNTIVDNGYSGIHVSSNSKAVVTNNILSHNGCFGIDVVSTQSVDMTFNNLWKNEWGSINIHKGQESFVTYESNYVCNPYYVDIDNRDYHLQEGSPCTDAGDPKSGYENEPDPNGGRINLGAFGNTHEAVVTTDFVYNDNKMIAQWTFNDPDADYAYDSSESQLHGFIHGAEKITSQDGHYLNFNGSDHYVSFDTSDSLSIGSAITISGWVKVSDCYGWIVYKDYRSAGGFGLHVGLDSANKGITGHFYTGSSDNRVYGKTNIQDDKWHFVALTYDQQTVTLYVDGEVDGSQTLIAQDAYNAGNFFLGKCDWNEYFRGQMDDIDIHNYALSHDAIRTMYQGNVERIEIQSMNEPLAEGSRGIEDTHGGEEGSSGCFIGNLINY